MAVNGDSESMGRYKRLCALFSGLALCAVLIWAVWCSFGQVKRSAPQGGVGIRIYSHPHCASTTLRGSRKRPERPPHTLQTKTRVPCCSTYAPYGPSVVSTGGDAERSNPPRCMRAGRGSHLCVYGPFGARLSSTHAARCPLRSGIYCI
jgi:hypothetical protein